MKKVFLLQIAFYLSIVISYAQNSAPVALDDSYTVESCIYNYLDVLENDYDPDGDNLYLYEAYANHGAAFKMNEHEPNEAYIRYTISGESALVNMYDTIYYVLADSACSFPFNPPSYSDTGMVIVELKDGQCYYELDANNIKTGVKSEALSFFWNLQDSPISEIPKGSGKTTLFAASPWIGGLDVNDELHIAAQKNVFQEDFQFGPICSNNSYYDDAYGVKWNKVWGLTKEQIDYHMSHYNDANYEMPKAIENWPAHGDTDMGQAAYLALFEDVDNNGYYSPDGGDYPTIYGDEAVFFIVNDDVVHGETGGAKLGIEMHIMLYEFNTPEHSEFHNTLFMHYKIFNRSFSAYENTYFGMYTDFDIGYFNDDYIGSDVLRGAYYSYNGLPVDGNGDPSHYGGYPPAQALVFLRGPFMELDGTDNPAFDPETGNNCGYAVNGFGFGDGIVDNECIGMTNFIYNYADVQSPYTTERYYSFLRSKWQEDNELMFGSTMNDGTITPHPAITDLACNYMYSADSDPCNWGTAGEDPYGAGWTVPNSNTFFGDTWSELGMETEAGDRFGVGSTGPFTMHPGSEHNIHLAYVYARSYSPEDSLSIFALQNRIDSLRVAFANNETPNGGQIFAVSDEIQKEQKAELVNMFPNPAHSFLTLNNNTSAIVNYKIIDITGRMVAQGKLLPQENSIDISQLHKGVYLLKADDGKQMQSMKLIKH